MTTENDIIAWFGGRLPSEWTEHGAPDLTIDREEITVVVAMNQPELDDADEAAQAHADESRGRFP